MSQYYLINTLQIKNHISELDKLNSGRVLCWLDLLFENIQKNLLDTIKNDRFMVEVDHQKKEVTLLWDPLPSKHRKVIFDRDKTNESIYNTFMFAIEYSNRIEWWQEIIKEML